MNRTNKFHFLSDSLMVGVLAAMIMLSFRPIDDQSLAVHVVGLSSQQRDLLMVEVALDPALEVAYACVPAGILVFNATDSRSAEDLRTDVARLIGERSNNEISFLGTPRLEELQTQCAQHR